MESTLAAPTMDQLDSGLATLVAMLRAAHEHDFESDEGVTSQRSPHEE